MRHTRCGSGQRAAKFCREHKLWAAKSKTNNKQLRHEEIMSLMDRRSYKCQRSRVVDEDVKWWMEEEDFEAFHRFEMDIMEAEMNAKSNYVRSTAVGNIHLEQPNGVFHGMFVQLNSILTMRVKNRKACQQKYAINKYSIHFVGLSKVGVNWTNDMRLRLLLLLLNLGREARSMTAHNTNKNIALHQQGGIETIDIGGILNYYKKGSNDFRNLGR